MADGSTDFETAIERSGRLQFASLRSEIADEYVQVAGHMAAAAAYADDPAAMFVQLADAAEDIGAYLSSILRFCRRQALRGEVL